jgi:hypothetical protein
MIRDDIRKIGDGGTGRSGENRSLESEVLMPGGEGLTCQKAEAYNTFEVAVLNSIKFQYA